MLIEVPSGRIVQVPDDFESWPVSQQEAFLAEDERRAGIGGAEEFVRGLGRGAIEGTVGAAEMAARGISDIGRTAYAGIQAALDPEREFEDYFIEQDLASRENLTSEFAQEAIPAGDPESFAARSGEITGGLIAPVGPVAALGRAGQIARQSPTVQSAQALLRRPIRSTAAAAGVGGVSAAGGELAAQTLGEEFRPVGELAMGVAAPNLAQRTKDLGVRYAVGAAPDSAEIARSGQIYRAQRDLGMQPSAGSVGNPRAAYLETSATALPVASGGMGRRQEAQIDAAQEVLAQIADDLRPALSRPPATGVSGPADIGAQLRSAAGTGLARIDRYLNMLENQITRRAGGPGTPVRPRSTGRAVREQLRQLPTGEETTGAVSGFAGDLAADTRTLQPTRERLLQVDLAAAQNQLSRMRAGTAQANRMQQRIADINRQIEEGRAIPLQQFRGQRTRLGPRTDQPRGLPRGASKQLYREMTDDILRTIGEPRRAVRGGRPVDVGGPEVAQDFQNLMALERRLYNKRGSLAEGGDIRTLRAILDKPDDIAIYRWISEGQMLPHEKFQLLRRNMSPARWQRFASSFMGRLGHAGAGAQDAIGERFSPSVFMTNWNRMDEQTRSLLLPPDIRARMDRVADAMEGLKVRQQRGNPSGTAMTAIPIAMANQALGGGGSGFERLRQGLGVVIGSLLFRAGLLSDRTAQALSGQLPSLTGELAESAARLVPATAGTTNAPLTINMQYDEEGNLVGTPVP